ncbi:MAG TPA: MFS transporter [Stellaceae bacterium]|nr:MFS transporter [Stellaceae bacterium]
MDGDAVTRTDVPARLDRLPWSGFHTLVIAALGITWILDGLEVTLAGSIAAALQQSPRLHLSAEEVGLTGSAYLVGAVLGALGFGHLTDRLGRKRLFSVTLGLYLVATLLTALAWDFTSFAFFRLLTGAGIGGEYAAINSAIQELIPARLRGRTDLAVNGSFWLGTALGAGASVWLLDPGLFPPDLGWRLAFGTGALLGLFILYLRHFLPESPRWLMTHGRIAEAERVVAEIETRIGGVLPPPKGGVALVGSHRVTLGSVARTLLQRYPERTLLGLALMAAQAFCYNAIFFTYALVLTRSFGVAADRVGLYILPFALGNFLGPLLLGRLFDTLGRKPMIVLTYALAGALLAATAGLFMVGALDAMTQTLLWTIVFFFASAAASAAYLTVGESFPLELRALAIALFYAFGTLLGGVGGPWLFGVLIERGDIVLGYFLGAALMAAAALVELKLGIRAEGRPLEEVAAPLSAQSD